jgi:hypothetical protein
MDLSMFKKRKKKQILFMKKKTRKSEGCKADNLVLEIQA